MRRTNKVDGRKPGRPSNMARAVFGERLRTLMEERGLSAEETARRIRERLPKERLSSSDVEEFRQGRALPHLRHLDALSLALGIVPQDRLGRATDSDTAPESQPHSEPTGRVLLETHGDVARLDLEIVVTWDVALAILQLVRGHG
jgi:transcriptional regulator with XRE-family HTH domain